MLSRRVLVPMIRSLKLAPQRICAPISRSLSKTDSELLNYLEEQLDHEKTRNIGTIEGWSAIEVDGAIGSMKRTKDNETVTVRFNLNGAMPTLDEQDEMEKNNEEVLW